MLKIRLQRYGRKNDPSFRVVVLEGTEGPKSGSHVDQIGVYNAVTKQKTLDVEKAKHWLAKGAQPSDTVYNFLVSEGVIDGKKKNVLPSKKPIVKDLPAEASAKEGEPKEEAPAAPAADAAPVVETAPETPTEEPAPAPEAPAEEAPVADMSDEASAKSEETTA